MKLLIDTAALIWFLRKDEEISARAAGAIEDSRNQVYVSAAALWEISVKAATGALVAPEGLGERLSQDLEEAGFRILPIEGRHAEEVYRLPRVHPDPFDRLMIAQCRCEKMTAVTNDRCPRRSGRGSELARRGSERYQPLRRGRFVRRSFDIWPTISKGNYRSARPVLETWRGCS